MTQSRRNKVVDLLRRAIARGLPTHNPEDILSMCDKGEMQLWLHPDDDTLIVTSICQHPRLSVCRLEYAAGRLRDIMEMLPRVEKWASENGCHVVAGAGRKGWPRVLKDYSPVAVEFYKEI